MNRTRTIAFCLFAFALFIMTSCAVVPHPNEKLIVGIWKPVNIEKIIDSSALQAAVSQPADSSRMKSKTGKPGGPGAGNRKEANLDRLMQVEMRTTLEIFADHTAIKNYPGKVIHATWKMKGQGTRLVGKNKENKMKFVIDILEIGRERVVVAEHLPPGDLKITYAKEK